MRLSELSNCYGNILFKAENGDIDLKTSRLRGIRTPVESDDAVNKNYVDELTNEIIKNIFKANAPMRARIIKDIQSSLKTSMSELTIHLEDKYYTKAEVDKLIEKRL